MFFQLRSTIKEKIVDEMMQSVYLGYFTCQAQKITIYRGFKLISYTIFCKMSAKIATIVGDVHGPPAASPPNKI